jgi:hypothetical protein
VPGATSLVAHRSRRFAVEDIAASARNLPNDRL